MQTTGLKANRTRKLPRPTRLDLPWKTSKSKNCAARQTIPSTTTHKHVGYAPQSPMTRARRKINSVTWARVISGRRLRDAGESKGTGFCFSLFGEEADRSPPNFVILSITWSGVCDESRFSSRSPLTSMPATNHGRNCSGMTPRNSIDEALCNGPEFPRNCPG
jgi:hypothetical protein